MDSPSHIINELLLGYENESCIEADLVHSNYISDSLGDIAKNLKENTVH